MNLQSIMLCERSQEQKIPYCMFPFIWNSRKDKAIVTESVSVERSEGTDYTEAWENFFFLLFLFRLHPWHMEVPRLGVRLELQLPAYATATATRDSSHISDLYHSSWQHWIFNWARPGIEPASLWILVRFVNHWAMKGFPRELFEW